MAMTAVATRMAYWAKDAGFEQWRRGLLQSEESSAQANVKLADLSYEMPELAVAGAKDESDAE